MWIYRIGTWILLNGGHHVDFEQWLGQVNPRRVNQYPPVFCWVPVL